MTRHGDTRLAALRPFLKLIRPESRYVYVCGNVPTPAAICNILLRFFFITSRPGAHRLSRFLLFFPSAEMKLSPAFVERKDTAQEQKAEVRVDENEAAAEGSAVLWPD